MAYTYKQRKALEHYQVRLFRTDIRTFSLERLQREFSAESSGRIVLNRLIRCAVFQAAMWMKRGKFPKIESNLRGFYYLHLRPILAKIPKRLHDQKADPYDKMIKAFRLFVVELELFAYRDLDLDDENWENRFYSKEKNPHIFVFAEKNGFVRFLQQVHRKYDITALSLGGYPSHLGTEYFVEKFSRLHPDEKELVIFGITDFEPQRPLHRRSFS